MKMRRLMYVIELNFLSILADERDNTLKSCSCSIKRVYDKKFSGNIGFSQKAIFQIIIPVNAYSIGWCSKKENIFRSQL